MKKRICDLWNNTPIDRIDYVDNICQTITKKATEDIRKHNLDEIPYTIE